VQVEIGGTALVEESLNKLVVKSQLSSLPLSLLLVFLTLAVFYRSGWAGLVGITPLAISILINFGVMGAFGIKLNIGTAMVASIAVGIGIDYTIHYMAAYHREYLATGGKGEFLRRTFLTSGKAIIFNAASVGLGFAVLALSQFTILAELGMLMALTMGTSALVSLTVLPVLLETFKPAFIRRPLPHDKEIFTSEVAND
jgi:predicted RND superfamily exporter protein